MKERYITAKELAEELCLPITWVWLAAREGRIPHLRAGRYQRFKLCEVEAALAEGKESHPEEPDIDQQNE